MSDFHTMLARNQMTTVRRETSLRTLPAKATNFKFCGLRIAIPEG